MVTESACRIVREELHDDHTREGATGIRDDGRPLAKNDNGNDGEGGSARYSDGNDGNGGLPSGSDGGAIVGLLAEREGLLR